MRVLALGLFFAFLCCPQQQGVVSGTVIDSATRLPLQGVVVRAGIRTIRTDAEGRYALSLAPGSVTMKVARAGYFTPVPSSRQTEVAAGQTVNVDFELKPLLRISGTVEDSDTGAPMTGAHVFAYRMVFALGKMWPIPAGLITADTRYGKFQIHDLEPGAYILEVVPEESAQVVASDKPAPASSKLHVWSFYPDVSTPDMATPITLNENVDAPVRIRMRARPTHSIAGVVSEPSRIEVTRMVAGRTVSVASGTISSAGPFRVELPEGDYKIQAIGFRGSFAEAPVLIGDHDVADVRLNPQPGVVTTGVVQMDDPALSLPQGLRVISGEKQARVVNGKFEITSAAGVKGLRLAGLPEGYAIARVQDFPAIAYTITKKTGVLRGSVGERIAVLLPEMKQWSGDFQAVLAAGEYQIVILDGDEKLLAGVPEFFKEKAAIDSRTIEISAGETTALMIP